MKNKKREKKITSKLSDKTCSLSFLFVINKMLLITCFYILKKIDIGSLSSIFFNFRFAL